MTKTKNTNQLIKEITDSLFDQLDVRQFEPIEQKTKMSGETNYSYNKDAVFLIGGIVNQVAWSLASKTKYLADLNKEFVERQVVENSSEEIKPNAIVKAEASLHNGYIFFDLLQDMFHVYTGWEWNDGKSTSDFGQAWFANHKEKTKGNKVLSDSKDIKAQMKARMKAR